MHIYILKKIYAVVLSKLFKNVASLLSCLLLYKILAKLKAKSYGLQRK